MSQFLLMIRNGAPDLSKASPKEIEDVMNKYGAWTQKLINEGIYAGGEKLSRDPGKTLRSRGGEVIVDGPYADTKEAIGGYYIVKAKTLGDACSIGKGCPGLAYGGTVEVREVEEM